MPFGFASRTSTVRLLDELDVSVERFCELHDPVNTDTAAGIGASEVGAAGSVYLVLSVLVFVDLCREAESSYWKTLSGAHKDALRSAIVSATAVLPELRPDAPQPWHAFVSAPSQSALSINPDASKQMN